MTREGAEALIRLGVFMSPCCHARFRTRVWRRSSSDPYQEVAIFCGACQKDFGDIDEPYVRARLEQLSQMVLCD